MNLPVSFLNMMMMMMMCLLFSDLRVLGESATIKYTTLIYKECAKHEFSNPSALYSQALPALFSSLVTQSNKTRFYKTTIFTGTTTINGLFQCRGDLSNNDCHKCVSRLPVLSHKLCGKTNAARIQLSGCYILFEVAGFSQISGVGMLSKTCGKSNIVELGFEARRDRAFEMTQNGILKGPKHGFYATTYESMYVLGQCEGDVRDTECSGCIKNALKKARVECGHAISGQIYLHKCFIAYSYNPNGVPGRSSSSSSPSSGSSGSDPLTFTGATAKTVAIVIGVAGLAFLVICLLACLKKKYDDHGRS